MEKHQVFDLRFVKASFVLAITPSILGMFITHLFLGTSFNEGFVIILLALGMLSTIIIKLNHKYYKIVPEYIIKMKKVFAFMFLFGVLGAYSTTSVANNAEAGASLLLLVVYCISIWQLTRSESALLMKNHVLNGM